MASDLTDRLAGVRSSLAIKAPVRVATTANITLSGLQTIDGVALAANDRVLVKDQTTGAHNGIYVASTGLWQRAKDWNGSGDVVTGTMVLVTDGSTNTGRWSVTTSGTITIGTTSITLEAEASLVIGNGSVTYAKIQDVSATQRVLARDTAGSGSVEEVQISDILDWLGTTQGSVLYRGASGWSGLAPGTSGQYLKTTGAGSDPTWATPAGAGDMLVSVYDPGGTAADAFDMDNMSPFQETGTGSVAETWKAAIQDLGFRAASFGVTGDGTTDDAPALQAAIDALYSRLSAGLSGGIATGPAFLDLPAGTLRIASRVEFQPLVILRGKGVSSTCIKAANGLDDFMFATPNYDLLTGTDICLPGEGVINNIGFCHLRIDGNKANQTADNGVRMIAKGIYIEHVDILNVYGTGLITELGQQCPLNDWDITVEGFISNIKIYNCSGRPWEHYGPHDSYINYAKMWLCDGGGFYCENNGTTKYSTMDITHMHIYACGGKAFHAKNVGVKGSFLRFENADEEGLYLEDCENVSMDFVSLLDNGRTSGSYQGVIDSASDNVNISNLRGRRSGRAACGGLYVSGTHHVIRGSMSGDITGGGYSTGVGLDLDGLYYSDIEVSVEGYSGSGGTALRTGAATACSWNRIAGVLASAAAPSTLWNNVTQGTNNHITLVGNGVSGVTTFTGAARNTGTSTEEIWNISLREAGGTATKWVPYLAGGTDVAVADGGTGSSTASGARTNLGLVIGTDVQAYDADLASWAGVTRASGFDTFAATPSSANLRSLVTDETGSGALVFATSPTLVTPALGTPSSGTLTNCTGLPVAGGGTGASTARGAMANLGSWYVLGHSAVQSSQLTGTASETTFATVTIPANALGPNGIIRVTAQWTYTNSANAKYTRIRLGGLAGTAFTQNTLSTTATIQVYCIIHNVNSASSQKGQPANYTGIGGTIVAPVTASIDTTSDVDLVLTGQLTNTGESMYLESYLVEILYGA